MRGSANQMMRFAAFLAIGLATAGAALAQAEPARVPLSPIAKQLPPLLFSSDLLGGSAQPQPGVTAFSDPTTRLAIMPVASSEPPLGPAAQAASDAAGMPAEELPLPAEQAALTAPTAPTDEPAAEPPPAVPEEASAPAEEPPPEKPKSPKTTTITVIVENVESGSGMVNVAVCDKGLSREGCPYVHEIKAQQGFVETEFRDIPPGNYAVVGYHDVNGNNSFDKLLGMPREPYALSSKAAEKLVPTFADAALPIKAGENAVIIRLKRLGG